jgi:hypothetical protein
MAITVVANPTALAWSNFSPVDSLAGDEDAHIDFNFVIPNRPPRHAGGSWSLAETFEIAVSPIARVLRDAAQTDALLEHEQGHYDIALAVAWAMAADLQALSARTPAALSQALSAAFNLHRRARMAVVQHRYDADTRHSRDTDRQTAWETAIANALTTHASTLNGLPL